MAVQLLDNATPTEIDRLVEDYLNHCVAKGLAPRTIEKSYGYALNVVFLPWCEDQGVSRLGELDRRTLDRFTTSLLTRTKADGKPLSKYSVHAYIRPVRQMLKWAKRMGEKVKAKPQLPRRSKPYHEILTREEIDLLEMSAGSERDRLIIRIFADCGIRLDELTSLRVQDIVRSGRRAHLHVHGKLDRWRDVPLSPTLLRRVDRHISYLPADRTSDRIFIAQHRGASGQYEALTTNGVYQAVRDAKDRAKVTKRVHPHLFRHSWMTEMVRLGMHPIQLAAISGASIEVINRYYAHLTTEDAYKAMLKLSEDSDLN